MRTIAMTIMAAALVSACASTPHQELREHSAQGVPDSSPSDTRRRPEPNVELQIYENPDLHLAAVDPDPRRRQALRTSG